MPIPIDDVRLVLPLYDPKTGKTQDTIIQNVTTGGPLQERPIGSLLPKYSRYIEGTMVNIPWPRQQPPNFEREDVDTPRILADKDTFIPPLNDYPFPYSVMDELRNKFSSFRDRHEPHYLAAKLEQNVQSEYLGTRNLLTPRAEYLHQQAELRRKAREAEVVDAEGKLKLPDSSVNFIREYMESRKQQESAGN